MKRLIAVLALVAGSALLATPATAADEDVCPPLSSGKIDVSGEPTTLTISAPEGFLIDFYCVKAGSAEQGDGPETVEVDPPAATVVIEHSTGKGISHYSAHYIKEETPPTPEPSVKPGEEDGEALPATGGNDLWLLLVGGVLGTAGVLTLTARRFMH